MKYIICMLCILLFSCGLTRVNSYPENKPSIIERDIYYDINFTESELKMIEAASKEWQYATRGMIKIHIMAGMPIDKDKDYKQNIIIKYRSDDPYILDIIHNQMHDKGQLLGFEQLSADGKHFIIGIVTDAMKTDTQLKLNIVHEMGHAIGLAHVDAGPAVMNSMYDKNVRCLTETDMINFCDMYGCDHRLMNYYPDYNVINQMFHQNVNN